MNIAYLIIGGNKGDKIENLNAAIQLLEKRAGKILLISDIFITAAWGNTDQPDFFNQAICIQTTLSPYELLNINLVIEENLGRIRTEKKWMARTMDIDILFFNNEIIQTNDLKIPHPYIQDRKFVLIPLAQIAPAYIHPFLKKNVDELLKRCTDKLEVHTFQQLIDKPSNAVK